MSAKQHETSRDSNTSGYAKEHKQNQLVYFRKRLTLLRERFVAVSPCDKNRRNG
jgi:hypothetical protein